MRHFVTSAEQSSRLVVLAFPRTCSWCDAVPVKSIDLIVEGRRIVELVYPFS